MKNTMMMLPRRPISPSSVKNDLRGKCKGRLVKLKNLFDEDQRKYIFQEDFHNTHEIYQDVKPGTYMSNLLFGDMSSRHFVPLECEKTRYFSSKEHHPNSLCGFYSNDADDLNLKSDYSQKRHGTLDSGYLSSINSAGMSDVDNRVNEQKRNVEKWLQDCQRYTRKKNSLSRKQNEEDKLAKIVTCPSWMKTAGQMRSKRIKRQVVDDSLFGKKANNLPETTSDIACKNKQARIGDCVQTSSAVRKIEQLASSEDKIFFLQTVGEAGVDLSSFFKDTDKNKQSAFISCCFQRKNSKLNVHTPKGVVTYKKL